MKLNIKFLHDNAKLPTYGTPGSAGLDLYACEDCVVEPHTRKLLPTGIALSWEGSDAENYYMRIAPRSGLAVKNSIDIGAGVIDKDYIFEIKICLINNGNEPFTIKIGDRIAQMVLEKINRFVEIVEVKELQKTSRIGGFGSTDLLKF